MKRAFGFLALTLALVSTGCNSCNSCRPRLFGNLFNRGDNCDSGCGECGCNGGDMGGNWMGNSGSTTCTNCSNHVPTSTDGWVPASGSNVIHGYLPGEETLPNPTRIGPQG